MNRRSVSLLLGEWAVDGVDASCTGGAAYRSGDRYGSGDNTDGSALDWSTLRLRLAAVTFVLAQVGLACLRLGLACVGLACVGLACLGVGLDVQVDVAVVTLDLEGAGMGLQVAMVQVEGGLSSSKSVTKQELVAEESKADNEKRGIAPNEKSRG